MNLKTKLMINKIIICCNLGFIKAVFKAGVTIMASKAA